MHDNAYLERLIDLREEMRTALKRSRPRKALRNELTGVRLWNLEELIINWQATVRSDLSGSHLQRTLTNLTPDP